MKLKRLLNIGVTTLATTIFCSYINIVEATVLAPDNSQQIATVQSVNKPIFYAAIDPKLGDLVIGFSFSRIEDMFPSSDISLKNFGIEVVDSNNNKYVIENLNPTSYFYINGFNCDNFTLIKLRNPLNIRTLHNYNRNDLTYKYDKEELKEQEKCIKKYLSQNIDIDNGFNFKIGETYKIRLFNKNNETVTEGDCTSEDFSYFSYKNLLQKITQSNESYSCKPYNSDLIKDLIDFKRKILEISKSEESQFKEESIRKIITEFLERISYETEILGLFNPTFPNMNIKISNLDFDQEDVKSKIYNLSSILYELLDEIIKIANGEKSDLKRASKDFNNFLKELKYKSNINKTSKIFNKFLEKLQHNAKKSPLKVMLKSMTQGLDFVEQQRNTFSKNPVLTLEKCILNIKNKNKHKKRNKNKQKKNKGVITIEGHNDNVRLIKNNQSVKN